MDFRHFIGSSPTQISGHYLNFIIEKCTLTPGNTATLSKRVEVFCLSRLAAFPLIVCAALDLVYLSAMGLITILTNKAQGKHYFINLVATLTLFPQALAALFLGNRVDEHAEQQLILAKFKSFDKDFLDSALSAIDSGWTLLTYILDSSRPPRLNHTLWKLARAANSTTRLELLSFLIENINLKIEPHRSQPYLERLLVENLKVDLNDLELQVGNLKADPLNNDKYESLAKKLIEGGALTLTRETSSFKYISYSKLPLFNKRSDLDLSVQNGWQSITEMLLKIDDNLVPLLAPEERRTRNNKLLGIASYYEKSSLMKFMLSQGADPLALFNETCAWNLALDAYYAEGIQILLQTGINPNSPLLGPVQITLNQPDENSLRPIDFILLGFSQVADRCGYHPFSPRDAGRIIYTNKATIEKRLGAAKMLLCNEAELDKTDFLTGVNLLREHFLDEEEGHQPGADKNICEKVEKLAKELAKETPSNLLLRKIALFAKNRKFDFNLIGHLSKFNDHLPELNVEIINANTLAIRAAIPEEQNQGFVMPLVKLISEFCYS